MTWALSKTFLGRSAIVLAVGTVLAAGLWWAGAVEHAWLGYLLAGLAWPGAGRALRPTATGDSAGTMHATRAERLIPLDRLSDLPDGIYDLLPLASHVTVRARKLRLFRVDARLDAPSGEVTLSGGEVAAELEVHAATFRSGNSRRDVHVLGPTFLDARRHPYLRFSTGGAVTTERGRAHAPGGYSGGSTAPSGPRPGSGDPVALVSGRAEVRGQQVPVVWTVTDLAHDPVTGEVSVRATTSVRRRDFGMRRLIWLAGDEVGIEVAVAARLRAAR